MASSLVSWATSHGASLHPSVQVYRDAETGLSFRVDPSASNGTQPGETIVSLPANLTLSYLNALPGRTQNDPEPFPASFVAKVPPHVVGRFLLAKHFLLGNASFWAPYIQSLPQPNQPNDDAWRLPPFWPDDDAELLEGTNVEVGLRQTHASVLAEFEHARQVLADEQWEPSLVEGLVLSLYQWAYCVFSSRSFRPSLVLSAADRATLPAGVAVDDFSVLMPLFDVGNHDMTEQVRWELDEGRGSCQLKVARAYRPGEQVFNNYSLKTNAELLLGYGFMIPATDRLHNDYVHVRKRQTASGPSTEEYYISLRPVHHPSSLLARSKQMLRLSEGTKVIGAFQHVQHDMVWDIFCALVPSEHHAQLIPTENLEGDAAEQARRDAFFSGQVNGDAFELVQQTAAIIQHKVMQELERLDESEYEVVGQGDLTRNQQLAMAYRAQCRRVLENTLEAMDADELLRQDEE